MQNDMIRHTLIFIILFLAVSCTNKNETVIIETELGNIKVELYSDKAPQTTSNFLKYVDSEYYKNSEFYRTVTNFNQPNNLIKIEVIQGGVLKDENIFAPVKHESTKETGIKHLKGVISMARSKPGTATDDFFICLKDEPELDFGGKRNPDGQGFAAFGKVISGFEIVQKIHQSYAEGQFLNPMIKIFNIKRIKQK